MNIKICGMKYAENITELGKLSIQMVGLIFYKKSPRYVEKLDIKTIKLPSYIQLVGVFVNEILENILHTIINYNINIVQLHGIESPGLCKELKKHGLIVIKAFQIESVEDFNLCVAYENVCDYFLFDTKTSQHGGSGKKFNWKILSFYYGETPFFLSGGINEDDGKIIKQLNNIQLFGIDLNSKFEIEPGLKNIDKIRSFIFNFTKL